MAECPALKHLPSDLFVQNLHVEDCPGLAELAGRIEGVSLAFVNCSDLRRLPHLRGASVRLHNCPQVRALDGVDTQTLSLNDCPRLRTLPEGIVVEKRLDLANTGITRLPDSLRDTPLYWRSVPIEHRILEHPESITAAEVLATDNAELRRTLLELMGAARFMREANAVVLDADSDAHGNPRRLLRVPLPRPDEDVVCVEVVDPSTGRVYLLRVPPATTTCRAAVAWVSGFDDPDDYRPTMET